MWLSSEEIFETVRMIEMEHLDVRTVTLGVSLLDCAGSSDIERVATMCYDKIVRVAGALKQVVEEVSDEFGIPIVNKRISVTPAAYVAAATTASDYTPLARALDRAAETVGVDFLGGFSALVHKGMKRCDEVFLDSVPSALAATSRVCASVNVASTRAGINMDAIERMGHIIREAAWASADRGGIHCSRLVTFSNVPEDNPFMAGAMHGIGESEAVINVGVSGPGVVRSALARLDPTADLGEVAEMIKRTSFKITRTGELVGREVSRRLGVRFGIVDLSLAPTPARGDSVAEILESMGLERCGTHGSTAALALLNDAVKKGGAMASSYVGGLSGAFIPVSEDAAMVDAAAVGALSLDKLEAMTAVCSVGLDMVAVPGDVPAETLSAIIADEMAIGVINSKTTGVRIIPVPHKRAGDRVPYGGLLGEVIVMPVNPFSSVGFVQRRGRIPAPIQSLTN
ncbi:MAG: PFL family protein [Proteobacteria bacterium]|nr:PFL family protein [Pseudomonadota bacterium]